MISENALPVEPRPLVRFEPGGIRRHPAPEV
jgi:hypothetical protein